MKKIFIGFCLGTLIFTSCASEKPNISPLTNIFASEASLAKNESEINNSFVFNIKKNVHAAEISNLISTFPKTKNDAVNNELVELKSSLQSYLYALDAGNIANKDKAIKKFEKNYRKTQKLRKYLNQSDDEVVNRYLVRLKTNISLIEDSLVN